MDTKEKPNTDEKDPAPKKTKSGLLRALIVPLVAVVAGVGATHFLLPPLATGGEGSGAGAPSSAYGAAPGGGDAQKAASTPAATAGPVRNITYLLQNILVNLANTGAKRFLKISLAIDCEVPAKGTEDEMRLKIDSLKSKLQDRAIELLSARTVASLEGREAKVALKTELRTQLEPILAAATGGRIANLYYQEFVIQ